MTALPFPKNMIIFCKRIFMVGISLMKMVNMKKITILFVLLALIATLVAGQGTPIPSMTQAQIHADLAEAESPFLRSAGRRSEVRSRGSETMAAVDYGFCGAILGFAAGSSIPLWQNQTMTAAKPSRPFQLAQFHLAATSGSTDPTQGIWVTTPIPASPAVPPVFSPTANPWVEAGGVIAGAALSAGSMSWDTESCVGGRIQTGSAKKH